NGVTIKSVAPDAADSSSGTAYATVGDFLVVAETAADVQPFVDVQSGSGDALSDLPQFSKADDALSGDRLAFGFLNGSKLTDAVGAIDTQGVDFSSGLAGLWGGDSYTGIAVVADDPGLRINTVQIPATAAAASSSSATP